MPGRSSYILLPAYFNIIERRIIGSSKPLILLFTELFFFRNYFYEIIPFYTPVRYFTEYFFFFPAATVPAAMPPLMKSKATHRVRLPVSPVLTDPAFPIVEESAFPFLEEPASFSDGSLLFLLVSFASFSAFSMAASAAFTVSL